VIDQAEDLREKFIVCGLEELPTLSAEPITHVLSILDPQRDEPECFVDFGVHERLTLRFHDDVEPGEGRVLPAPEHVEALLRFGRTIDLSPEKRDHLLVHCTMGVSRSTASMAILLAQQNPEVPEDTIFARVLRVRRRAWPNSRLIEHADRVMGRGGRLVMGMRKLYGHQMVHRPDIADQIRRLNRKREIDMAIV
jgi:predicted protein tyrosine phosphatase